MSRILVIDDSPSTLETVALVLSGAGHQVRPCNDGQRARQMVEQDDFDLLLTDIFMPEKDGLEVIRETRRLRPNLPIVAMSGITGPRSMLRVAKLLGACQLLRKPFSGADLLAAIEAALGPASCANKPGERENRGPHQ